ncbi:26023_t:CDS:1, partial [Dentiscutata erythropus]
VHDLTQDTDSDNEDDESVCDLTQDIDSDKVQTTLDEFDCGEEVADIQESEEEENDVYYENESIEYSNAWD